MKSEKFYRVINRIPGAKKIAEKRVDKLLSHNKDYQPSNGINLYDLYQTRGDKTIYVQRDNAWYNRSVELSIIIPVYNTGAYLKKCLDCVLSQNTGIEYETIVVDDGSTDHATKQILSEYREGGYKNFSIITKDNGGISDARNFGISRSVGKYLMFVDSDDYITLDAVENLYSAAIANDADIVEGAYENVDEEGRTIFATKHDKGLLDKKSVSGYAWGKIFRASLFEDKQFPKGYWFEDSIIKPIILCTAKKLFGISDTVYFYRRNRNSISFAAQINYKCLDAYYITTMIHNDRQVFSIPDDQYYYDELLNIVRLTFRRTLCIPEEYKIRLFLEWCDFMGQFWDRYLTDRPVMKKLEKALKDRNYYAYDAWCKLNIG